MDLLREGQKVTIYFQKDNRMVEMSCEIEKLYDDRMDLVLPQYFMRYIERLQVGARLTAKVFSKFGTIDFNTVIIASPLEDNFTIELDYNAIKLTEGSAIPKIDAVEWLDIHLDNEVYSTKTFEISTESIKFYSDRKLALRENIDCTLKLPKTYGIINFRAIVSEIDAIYSNEITANIFTMTENDRQNLLYYMYVYTTNSD